MPPLLKLRVQVGETNLITLIDADSKIRDLAEKSISNYRSIQAKITNIHSSTDCNPSTRRKREEYAHVFVMQDGFILDDDETINDVFGNMDLVEIQFAQNKRFKANDDNSFLSNFVSLNQNDITSGPLFPNTITADTEESDCENLILKDSKKTASASAKVKKKKLLRSDNLSDIDVVQNSHLSTTKNSPSIHKSIVQSIDIVEKPSTKTKDVKNEIKELKKVPAIPESTRKSKSKAESTRTRASTTPEQKPSAVIDTHSIIETVFPKKKELKKVPAMPESTRNSKSKAESTRTRASAIIEQKPEFNLSNKILDSVAPSNSATKLEKSIQNAPITKTVERKSAKVSKMELSAIIKAPVSVPKIIEKVTGKTKSVPAKQSMKIEVVRSDSDAISTPLIARAGSKRLEIKTPRVSLLVKDRIPDTTIPANQDSINNIHGDTEIQESMRSTPALACAASKRLEIKTPRVSLLVKDRIHETTIPANQDIINNITDDTPSTRSKKAKVSSLKVVGDTAIKSSIVSSPSSFGDSSIIPKSITRASIKAILDPTLIVTDSKKLDPLNSEITPTVIKKLDSEKVLRDSIKEFKESQSSQPQGSTSKPKVVATFGFEAISSDSESSVSSIDSMSSKSTVKNSSNADSILTAAVRSTSDSIVSSSKSGGSSLPDNILDSGSSLEIGDSLDAIKNAGISHDSGIVSNSPSVLNNNMQRIRARDLIVNQRIMSPNLIPHRLVNNAKTLKTDLDESSQKLLIKAVNSKVSKTIDQTQRARPIKFKPLSQIQSKKIAKPIVYAADPIRNVESSSDSSSSDSSDDDIVGAARIKKRRKSMLLQIAKDGSLDLLVVQK